MLLSHSKPFSGLPFPLRIKSKFLTMAFKALHILTLSSLICLNMQRFRSCSLAIASIGGNGLPSHLLYYVISLLHVQIGCHYLRKALCVNPIQCSCSSKKHIPFSTWYHPVFTFTVLSTLWNYVMNLITWFLFLFPWVYAPREQGPYLFLYCLSEHFTL